MLAIKLKMVGRKNQRTFRVIIQEARSKLGGKFVEDIGWYNPHTNQIKVNKERASYWIRNGAQPTKTAGRILEKAESSETLTYEVRESRKKKKGPKEEGAAAETDAVTENAVAETQEKEVGEGAAQEITPETTPERVDAEEPKEEEPKEEEKIEETEKNEQEGEISEEPKENPIEEGGQNK